MIPPRKIHTLFSPPAILLTSIGLWMLVWCMHDLRILILQIPYYRFALTHPAEALRSLHCAYDDGSRDYYAILRLCDRIIPHSEKLNLVLPSDPVNRYEFLREKGRYYLYPRNYGNNRQDAKYALIYGLKNFEIPPNYRKVCSFADDKYLIAHYGSNLINTEQK